MHIGSEEMKFVGWNYLGYVIVDAENDWKAKEIIEKEKEGTYLGNINFLRRQSRILKIEIPKDIREGIEKLSEDTKKSIFDMIDRINDIIVTDEEVQNLDNDTYKVRYAWAKLYKEIRGGDKSESE